MESWIDPAAERIYAVVDNLNTHSALDVLLFNLAHPRWEFVFQPKYAAYLNLIEPWWKILRSLALKGRRFDAWWRSNKRSNAPLSIGMRTSTPSSGVGAGVIADRAAPGSQSCQMSPSFSGCTTKSPFDKG